MTQVNRNLPPDVPPNSVAGQVAGYTQAGWNLIQVLPPVAMHLFKRKFNNTLGFSTGNLWVLEKYGYG